jgi:tellurite resistance protein TehA-like permease
MKNTNKINRDKKSKSNGNIKIYTVFPFIYLVIVGLIILSVISLSFDKSYVINLSFDKSYKGVATDSQAKNIYNKVDNKM